MDADPPDAAWSTGACAAWRSAPPTPEPCTPAELRAMVHAGLNDSDACERALALVARIEGALDLEIGDGLAALRLGDRLISLGFLNLGDYAREILDIRERTAQAMAHLSLELRSRPLLRSAVRTGEVRPRNAQTVLPVALGDAEAEWVERARRESVRALEKAVRAARPGLEDDDEWTRFRVRLSPADRATVDEALAFAGRHLPGSRRPHQLEAMAQEYLADHAIEAGDDGTGGVGGAFRAEGDRLEQRKAQLEDETDRWSVLAKVASVEAPSAACDGFDVAASATEIDARLRELAATRRRWDALLGYHAYAVRRSGLWRIAGFVSFEHSCSERLGLSARAVEQRAALEKRLWEAPVPGRSEPHAPTVLRSTRSGASARPRARCAARTFPR